jgi:DNA-binding MarR family transcriptional regulator
MSVSKPRGPRRPAAGSDSPDAAPGWGRDRPDIDPDIRDVRAHLVAIANRIRHDNDKLARKQGVSGSDMRVLFALLRAGPPFRLRPTDLFESLLVPSATMTRQIERLAELGYVVRSPDPADGRVVMTSLTDKGAAAADAALSEAIRNSRVTRDLRGALSRSEIATLARLLGQVAAVMD